METEIKNLAVAHNLTTVSVMMTTGATKSFAVFLHPAEMSGCTSGYGATLDKALGDSLAELQRRREDAAAAAA